ncbi:MAG: SulP family inorganic anion transporter [Gammaproteobacteria bacterium]
MTLLALTEAVSIARSLAIHSGQKLDGNQEFIGQGLANIVASFSSAYVTTGSFNRSAINYAAGAQTPLSAIFAAVLLMAAVVLIAPLTNYLPTSALAGLLLLVAWSLIDFQHIRKIIRTSRSETAILASTFITTLLVDLEFAILLGVGLSLFLFVMNSTRPRIHSRIPDRSLPNSKFNTIPGALECPQLKILRLDGSLYFGSVYHIEKMLSIFRQREPRQKHLLLVSYSINQIDISGAEFLSQEATRRRSEGGGLYLYRTKEHVEAFLRRGGYLSHIGEENLFAKKGQVLPQFTKGSTNRFAPNASAVFSSSAILQTRCPGHRLSQLRRHRNKRNLHQQSLLSRSQSGPDRTPQSLSPSPYARHNFPDLPTHGKVFAYPANRPAKIRQSLRALKSIIHTLMSGIFGACREQPPAVTRKNRFRYFQIALIKPC